LKTHAAETDDARADGVLEHRARDSKSRHAAVAHGEPCAAEDPRNVAKVIARLASRGVELVVESRQEPLERVEATGEEAVSMTPLRDGRPRQGIVGQLRAFDQQDFFKGVRERARREESGDAGAEHDYSTI
jgi:hypothetical protein